MSNYRTRANTSLGVKRYLGEMTLFAKLQPFLGFIHSTCRNMGMKSLHLIWLTCSSTKYDVSLQNLAESVTLKVLLLLLLHALLNIGQNAACSLSETVLKHQPSTTFIVIFLQGFYVLPSTGLCLCRWGTGNKPCWVISYLKPTSIMLILKRDCHGAQ